MSKADKPRIILLMQFYDPEPVYKGQAFAEAVARAGYDVEVVTGFPNYPGGKVYEGYRIRPIERSERNGIAITRLAVYPSHDSSKIGRILNYVSFFFSAFLYLTCVARRANLVYAYHPPVTVGLAATAARLFRRHPVIVDIHDLWPDTLPATGMISNPRILKIVDLACNWMYKRATHLILHSHGFRGKLIERGVPAEKTTAIIGWTNESQAVVETAVPAMQALPGLKVLYAGNIGPAQALDSVIDAARALQEQGQGGAVTFCFLGSGLSMESLQAMARRQNLKNVHFLPRVTPTEVGAYFQAADVLLVHLRDDPLFAITMPSKAQAYMLAGRPILMGVRGEAAQLIEQGQCGISVTPQDARALADAVLSFADMPERERKRLGDNARAYYWRELCMDKGIARFVELFDRFRRP